MEGAPPTERTEVRFLFDRDCLYIGIRCFDSEPKKILAKQMQRDAWLVSDDCATVALDTFGRQREGYLLTVNPAGVRSDGTFSRYVPWENRQVDLLWSAKSRIDDLWWVAEVALPFKSVAFGREGAPWRGSHSKCWTSRP